MTAPYRNKVKCVGITSRPGAPRHHSPFAKLLEPDSIADGCQHGVDRFSVGPIPREPDENKSPRCPNCNGLMVEVAAIDSHGNVIPYDKLDAYLAAREQKRIEGRTTVITLDEASFDALSAEIEKPSQPTPALVALARQGVSRRQALGSQGRPCCLASRTPPHDHSIDCLLRKARVCTPDMRLTEIPLGGDAVCAGCDAPTDKHLYLGWIDSSGTRNGNSRGICTECRIALAEVLLEGLAS